MGLSWSTPPRGHLGRLLRGVILADPSAGSSWSTPPRGHLGRPFCGVILANSSAGSSWPTPLLGHLGQPLRVVILANPFAGLSWSTTLRSHLGQTPPRGHLGRLLRVVILAKPFRGIILADSSAEVRPQALELIQSGVLVFAFVEVGPQALDLLSRRSSYGVRVKEPIVKSSSRRARPVAQDKELKGRSSRCDDEEDNLFRGINSYRATLNLTRLTENEKAKCLAEKMADQFKGQPCTNSTGSNTVPGTEPRFTDYPKFLDKCDLNVTTTRDGAILPACVPHLDAGLVLSNYTLSQYSSYLNDTKFTGIGIGSEDDWMVVILTTSTPEGSYTPDTSSAALVLKLRLISRALLLMTLLMLFGTN
nr:uncharacterized GPI-anchored protein At5g19250-like [Ipomoea batatas]